MKSTIINKLKSKGFDKCENYGKILNYLQDIAYNKLTTSSIKNYELHMNHDMDECSEMDGILINGRYFDWREASWNKWAHVDAWLDYFSQKDLEKICNAI